MAQRILEPGQIETLARASIPRIRLPDRAGVFARRAARLRELAVGAPLGDYLRFLAALVEAQQALLIHPSMPAPDRANVDRAREHGMPPIQASTWPRSAQWRDTLESICGTLATRGDFPSGVGASIAMIRQRPSAWLEAQATSMLDGQNEAVDARVAPLIMAALQVYWLQLAGHFGADEVKTLEDTPGVCPLCGTPPVASVVHAQSPYQGYRYLHCALCAMEWHMVRVQCTHCGASGKNIGYHSLQSKAADKSPDERGGSVVRAETCEQCHGYRKILYQEKDPNAEPVADDVASIALDMLLAEQGYRRASGNPLLWLPNAI